MYYEELDACRENKALVKRFYQEYYNNGRRDAIDDLFDPSYVHHTPEIPAGMMSHEEFREHMLTLARAFPHMRVAIEDQIAERDKVATRLTLYGLQEGDLPGIPTRGKEIKVAAMTIFRIRDGRIVEGWESYDSLDMALQLGVAQVVSTLRKGKHEKGYFPGWDRYNV